MTIDVHKEAVTEAEITEKRIAVRKQREELLKQQITWVTCPCGKRIALKMGFRCWFCGLIFCWGCAEKHFGPKPLWAQAEAEKHRSD